MVIEHRGGKAIYFAEVSDFPYFNSLSAEAQVELKEERAKKIEEVNAMFDAMKCM